MNSKCVPVYGIGKVFQLSKTFMFWPRANSHTSKVETERKVEKSAENKHQAFRAAQSTYASAQSTDGPQNLSKLIFYCLKRTFYLNQTPHSATHV